MSATKNSYPKGTTFSRS